jgi:hypothetical protein
MKARNRAGGLDRLLAEAQTAMRHEVSTRRKAAQGDGVWPADRAAADLCTMLARTNHDQRGAFRGRLSHRQCVVLGQYGSRSSTKPPPTRAATRRTCYAGPVDAPT